MNERELEQFRADCQALMGTEGGRRWVMRLLEEVCGIHLASFSVEPILMARAEGKRAVGIQVMDELMTVDPAAWAKMLLESSEETLRRLAMKRPPPEVD